MDEVKDDKKSYKTLEEALEHTPSVGPAMTDEELAQKIATSPVNVNLNISLPGSKSLDE